MSKYSRLDLLANKQKIDRVPVLGHVESFAAKVYGITFYDYYFDVQKSYDAQSYCNSIFDYEGGEYFHIPNGYTKEFGGTLNYENMNKYGYPSVSNYPVTNYNELLNLKMPDIEESFMGKRSLKFAEIVDKNNGYIFISAGSPMNIAQNIVGSQLLLKWMLRDELAVKYLMEFCTEYIKLNFKKHIDKFGIDKIVSGMSLPMESNLLISDKMFEKYSLPYIQDIMYTLDYIGVEIESIHLCGDHSLNLKYWKNDISLKEGTLLTIGLEHDIIEIANYFNNKFIVGGDVPNSLLQTGDSKDVYAFCKKQITLKKDLPSGYVLAPDCTLSPMVPLENLNSMIKAAEDYGKY